MSLINPAILFGLGLIAIPILLHFLLRQKPKKLLFPALQLIQVRQRNNVRRMRLRHLWLLLLRVLVIGFLVLALARPSLPAAEYGLTLWESLRLLGIGVVALGLYFFLVRQWRNARLPHHEFAYRRSILRGGTGVAVLVLLLLLVVWPYWRRIDAELSGPQPEIRQNVPVAAVYLFDTSASMDYRLESKTRLERADELAVDYLEKLPARSRVAVGDTTEDTPILFQGDLTTARTRMSSLKAAPAVLPLSVRLRAALTLQEEDRKRTLDVDGAVPEDLRQDRYVREIYVFTDMAKSAWRKEDARLLKSEMERLPWISIYLIDVGVKQPTNVGISNLRLSRQTESEGGELTVEASLDAIGVESANRTVELYLKNETGDLVKKGQSTVTVDTQAGARVAFKLTNLKGPLAQGEVRLISSDPLPSDDLRWFTAVVRPPPEILLVGENSEDAVYWRLALAPTELEKLGKAPYRCSYLPANKLAESELAKFDVVCLFNVREPTEAAWEALGRYVSAGGGLAVFLGDQRIDPVSYNSKAAQAFLPAELLAHLKFRGDVFVDLKNLNHPMLDKFSDFEGGAYELTASPIFRHWRVEPNAAAAVVATYTDDRKTPAFLERPHGQGRTLMLTTAVDLRGWSELPLARWQFVALADQMMQHLGRISEGVYNYTAGDPVVLPVDRRTPVKQYLLRKPGLEQLPGEAPPDGRAIAIDRADQAGQYEVVSTDPAAPFTTGFSVNIPAGESNFTRIVEADLDTYLGEKRYRIASDMESLERIVSTGRLGQEMFPFVLAFLVAVFLVEHLAANFFYESDQAPQAARLGARSN